MVRVTRAGEYAIRGMIRLARDGGDSLALIADIAAAEGVSKSFLAKQFQRLVKAGLVESSRGAAGGVALARPAEQISLRDIIEAVEGPVELNRCLSASDRCKNADTCPLSDVWREAQTRMLDVLGGVTLAKITNRPNA